MRHIFQCDQWEILIDIWFMSSYVSMIYETCKASYIGLDSHFILVQVLNAYTIGVIYATRTIGAVRVLKYREEN